jgi:hypothetical protein
MVAFPRQRGGWPLIVQALASGHRLPFAASRVGSGGPRNDPPLGNRKPIHGTLFGAA